MLFFNKLESCVSTVCLRFRRFARRSVRAAERATLARCSAHWSAGAFLRGGSAHLTSAFGDLLNGLSPRKGLVTSALLRANFLRPGARVMGVDDLFRRVPRVSRLFPG